MGCRYDTPNVVEPGPLPKWEVTSSLKDLVTKSAVITSDVVASGVVITSDSAGSYYKEVLIAEFLPTDTTVIRISTAFYDSYGILPRGSVVAIRPKGLCFREYNGLPALGYEPAQGEERPGAIPTPYVCSTILNLQGQSVEIVPREVQIEQITESMVGLPVLLRSAYFQSPLGTIAGEKKLLQLGNTQTINLYTSPYCSFAGDAVPEGLIDIEAVVEMYRGDIQLKLISAQGITLLQK